MNVVPGTTDPLTSDERIQFTNSAGYRIVNHATAVDVSVKEERPTVERRHDRAPAKRIKSVGGLRSDLLLGLNPRGVLGIGPVGMLLPCEFSKLLLGGLAQRGKPGPHDLASIIWDGPIEFLIGRPWRIDKDETGCDPRVRGDEFCHCACPNRVADQRRAIQFGGVDDRSQIVNETS